MRYWAQPLVPLSSALSPFPRNEVCLAVTVNCSEKVLWKYAALLFPGTILSHILLSAPMCQHTLVDESFSAQFHRCTFVNPHFVGIRMKYLHTIISEFLFPKQLYSNLFPNVLNSNIRRTTTDEMKNELNNIIQTNEITCTRYSATRPDSLHQH